MAPAADRVRRWSFIAALFMIALGARKGASAQDASRSVRLSLTEAVRPVTLMPGGEVIVRGAVRSAYDGSVIDAHSTQTEVEIVAGGLYDLEAGGWTLVSRDPRAHSYRLAASGAPGSACVEAGVASPCLPIRLLPLAQSKLLSVSEFAATMSGELSLEVLDPDPVPLVVPPFVERHAATTGLVSMTLLAGLFGLTRWRRRAATPEATLRRAAARVRARLRSGDPVIRLLAPSIDALVEHAEELVALRDRLRARVAAADSSALSARRRALLLTEQAGVVEAAGAGALVDEQIDRVAEWRREAERAAIRIAEAREYLEALLQRLDESRDKSRHGETTRAALASLEQELQLALSSAREADAAARA